MPSKLSPEKNKIKIYESAITELRFSNDRLDRLYDSRRSRAILFLGGGFALLGYLFSDGNFIEKVFLSPIEIDRIVFFLLGVTLVTTALIYLFIVTRPVIWMLTTDTKDLKKMEYKNYLQFLEYLKEEGRIAFSKNSQQHEIKQRYFDFGSFLLIIGAVVLIVIKELGRRCIC